MMLVGSLLGQKTILNEFVAYFQMQQWKDAGLFMYEKSVIMSTYILCGFANISSIGILLGGLGVLAPNKQSMKHDYKTWNSNHDRRGAGLYPVGNDGGNDFRIINYYANILYARYSC